MYIYEKEKVTCIETVQAILAQVLGVVAMVTIIILLSL